MKLSDSFRLSVNSILHRKLRSWLTLLGIVIGVAAVVSIISIGEGAQVSMTQKLSGFGADIITISPGFSGTSEFFGGLKGGKGHKSGADAIESSQTISSAITPTLTKRDATIIRGNPNVEYVNEIVSGRGELIFLAEKLTVTINGVNPNTWKNVANLELASGRYLSASDSTAIVIGDRIANNTFKQPITLGRQLSIEGKSFTIAGVLKPSGSGTSDSTIYMPFESAWTITDVNKDTFSSIQAKVYNAESVEETTEQLTEALMISRRVTERNQDFSITSALAVQERLNEVSQTLTLFLGAIAAVSLLVGAIGIANSMFTSVLEKTREVGILKALGSTNYEVLRLFIIESGLFGLVGGIIGVLLGIVASLGISSLGVRLMGGGGEVTTLVTPQLIVFAIILSTIIGVVSGILPARTASKLKPIEALRYE